MSQSYNRGIIAASIVGIWLSVYSLHVEMAAHSQPGYKALCDLSKHASCTKVLTSEFAKGFGIMKKNSAFEIPNCIYGVLFYSTMIFLATFENRSVLILQTMMACSCIVMSIYLAYLLAFVLYDFCLVCASTYLVNFVISIFVFGKVKSRNEKLTKKVN